MNDSEFAVIVGRTKNTVLSAVRTHLAARYFYTIDDVVQETYIRGFRHLSSGRFRGDSSLDTWLYAIARNESLRMNMRLCREEKKAEKASERFNAAGTDGDAAEDRMDMDALLEKLPEKYRSVLSLKAQGIAEHDIAKMLNINEGTVKSRFSRGKQMLQKI